MANSLLPGGLTAAFQTVMPAINSAYWAAGMSQYVIRAAAFYSGTPDDPNSATDDSQIDSTNYPTKTNIALGAAPTDTNIVLWCSKTDANGQSIGDAYVNARAGWDIFQAGGIKAFQEYVNETVQKAPALSGAGGFTAVTPDGVKPVNPDGSIG